MITIIVRYCYYGVYQAGTTDEGDGVYYTDQSNDFGVLKMAL